MSSIFTCLPKQWTPILPFQFIFTFVILFSLVSTVQAANSTSSNTSAPKNSTLDATQNKDLIDIRRQIKCYALPYGALGCASHVLTYYCLVVNALGRKPLMPWKRQQYKWLNVVIGTLQLIGAVIS
jgi:hypothetical protein